MELTYRDYDGLDLLTDSEIANSTNGLLYQTIDAAKAVLQVHNNTTTTNGGPGPLEVSHAHTNLEKARKELSTRNTAEPTWA